MGYCGPGKGLGEWLVPDSILGVDISDICECHDKDYNLGRPRNSTDLVFRNRLMLRMRLYGGIMMSVRFFVAEGYYLAVHYFGQHSWLRAQEKKR